MINPKNGWIEMMIQSAVATLVFAAVAMGCATPEAPIGATASSMVQSIGEVSVTRDGDDSVVRLAGLIDPIFSVTTPGDETLVVIDLVDVGMSDAMSTMGTVRDEAQQVAPYDGVVDSRDGLDLRGSGWNSADSNRDCDVGCRDRSGRSDFGRSRDSCHPGSFILG